MSTKLALFWCRRIGWIARCFVLIGICPSVAFAASQCTTMDGTVDFIFHETGFVVGYGVGQGTLKYENRQYPLEIRGGGVLTLGHATLIGHACVTHLGRLSDFAGTYWSVGGGSSIVNGVFVADMENAQGVDLRVQGRVHGPLMSGQIARFSVSFRSDSMPDSYGVSSVKR